MTYRPIPFLHGLCVSCDQVVPLSPGKAYGRMHRPAVMYAHGPRGARCSGSRQPPVPWLAATGLPGWDAMSELDRGAALMFTWKAQREGYIYARENYPARYLDDAELAELGTDDYVVTCSPGGGVLSAITPTVNGFVILDATPAQPGQPGDAFTCPACGSGDFELQLGGRDNGEIRCRACERILSPAGGAR